MEETDFLYLVDRSNFLTSFAASVFRSSKPPLQRDVTDYLYAAKHTDKLNC